MVYSLFPTTKDSKYIKSPQTESTRNALREQLPPDQFEKHPLGEITPKVGYPLKTEITIIAPQKDITTLKDDTRHSSSTLGESLILQARDDQTPSVTTSVSTRSSATDYNDLHSTDYVTSSVANYNDSAHGVSWFDDGKSARTTSMFGGASLLGTAKSPSKGGAESIMTCDSGVCSFADDDWFAQFDGDLDISDDVPSISDMKRIGEFPLYDAAGKSRPFKSLYAPGEVVGTRQLFVFIRHFYCGACQAYIRALTQAITAQEYFSLPNPTSIIVIGCGKPELIRYYKAFTSCPFPIFADPSRQIFKALGMGISANMFGSSRPDYMKDINVGKWIGGQMKEMTPAKGKKLFMGGNVLQIGGEFLFQDGQVVWGHRMKNMRGHADMDVIKRILEIEG